MTEAVLKDLRDKRTQELERAEAITALAKKEERGVSPDEQAQFNAHLKEAKRIEGILEDAARLADSERQLEEARGYAPPELTRSTPETKKGEETPRVEVRENSRAAYQKGDALAAIIAGRLQFGPWEQQRAINWARDLFGGESRPEVRALQQTSFTAGGALIPENFQNEFIELLRAQAAFRRAGARQVTLTNGTFTAPKLVTGSSVEWLGAEGDNISTTEPTFGQLVLAEKKMAAIIPFSNDLRRNASIDAVRAVRDDLVTAAANAEDVACLKGSGLAGQPKGVYYWVGDAGRTDSAGTSLAQVRQDVRTAKNYLDTNNAPNRNRAWFMHSRSMNYMGWDLVDGNSNFAFPSLQNSTGASLGGDPVFRDNNISITENTDKSEIYYVEMSECFIADGPGMEIEIFDNATYSQSGTLRSGISRDESVIRLIRKMDFGMRHIVSAHVTEAVGYGA